MARKKTSRSISRHPIARSPTRRIASPSSRVRRRVHRLSPERKMDILGVLLIIIGVISLLGFFSSTAGGLTGWIVRTLALIAGIGSLLFPIVIILVGLWLILRNTARFPKISIERLSGILSLYINILGWIHWFSGGGWGLAAAGGGGGYLGAVFERILVISLGDGGALVVLVAWLLVALALTFDLSIPDLFRKMTKPALKTGSLIVEKTTHLTKSSSRKSLQSQKENRRVFFPKEALQPEGFSPIEPGAAGNIQPAKRKERGISLDQVAGRSGGDQISRSTQSPDAGIHWQLPPLDEILNPAMKAVVRKNIDQDRARVIEETLSSFGAPVHVVETHRGPAFTQYGLEPDFIETRSGRMRVRVNKITSLADDLALALAAPSIRIQAPVPGRRYIGIEVPNTEAELVSLREGMEVASFQKMSAFLKFVLGKDVAGKPVAVDLAQMPHLLIAGTTGSGKSVCINSILSCMLLLHTPDELRLVMVDPKRVELTGYNGIPHLLTPVIIDHAKVVGTLQWMSREMDSRYKKFAEAGARNIDDYNAHQQTKLPYIIVVIDELADLMMLAPEETERNLNRLAQLARATGIHVIIATQRPSVDVITGMIKANFPARISFSVVSGVDSRVILDQPGAERLVGRGDLLFHAPDAPSPRRLQGVFVSNEEIQRLVRFWKDQTRQLAELSPDVRDLLPQKVFPGTSLTQTPLFEPAPEPDEDPLLHQAIDIVRAEERASISMLQRKLRVGYTRAARLIDHMEELQIVGKPDDSLGTRPVLDFGEEDNRY